MRFDLSPIALTEYDDDGFLTTQVTLHGDDAASDPAETLPMNNVLARGLDPASDRGGTLMHAYHAGGFSRGFTTADPRQLETLPPLDKGGAHFYGGFPVGHLTWSGLGGLTATVPMGQTINLGGTGTVGAAKADVLDQILVILETLTVAIATAVDAKLPPSPGVNAGLANTAKAQIDALRMTLATTTVLVK